MDPNLITFPEVPDEGPVAYKPKDMDFEAVRFYNALAILSMVVAAVFLAFLLKRMFFSNIGARRKLRDLLVTMRASGKNGK